MKTKENTVAAMTIRNTIAVISAVASTISRNSRNDRLRFRIMSRIAPAAPAELSAVVELEVDAAQPAWQEGVEAQRVVRESKDSDGARSTEKRRVGKGLGHTCQTRWA